MLVTFRFFSELQTSLRNRHLYLGVLINISNLYLKGSSALPPPKSALPDGLPLVN